jgi:glycosyltransferase involved in cell wall biosynthesis
MTPAAPPIETIRAYYDDFAPQLLVDYVHGNPRIERAIELLLRWTPAGARNVLDIGCGLGWSSHEIARNRRRARVLGLDLSDASIDMARRLFSADNLRFDTIDVTTPSWAPETTYDVVSLLDVYEHVPADSRDAFNRAVASLLSDDARIVFTLPSESHQTFLAREDPEGLQPVDETITRPILEDFAQVSGGQVVAFEPVTVWSPGDYIHAVIEKGTPPPPQPGVEGLEPRHDRDARVRGRLHIRITDDAYAIPDLPGPPVLVVAPIRGAYSETFIKAQIECLPTRVEVLFGIIPDVEDDQHRQLVPRTVRRVGRVAGQFLGSKARDQINALWLDRYMRRLGIRAVLAEYGPTGADLVGACARRGIPLVTVFHGFDATDGSVLKERETGYARLFASGNPIVAVSRDLKERLQRIGAQEVHVIPCGVDAARFAPATPSENPPIFMAIGRFVEKKAPHLTIVAFNRVAAVVPDARLVMVGDGPLLGACQQLVRSLGLQNSVAFLGPRSHRHMPGLLRGARAFVQHSMTASSGDSEGTPVSLLEAGAAGLPLVATRHGGIPDVVIDGETGFLVDEGDLDAMAEAMIRLSNEPKVADRLGSNARQRVIERFALDDTIGSLWEIVRIAIASNSPPGTVSTGSVSSPVRDQSK